MLKFCKQHFHCNQGRQYQSKTIPDACTEIVWVENNNNNNILNSFTFTSVSPREQMELN